MWNEWLARTLRPRPIQSATLKHAHASASTAIEETGMDELRLSPAALRAPAQDQEERSFAAEA